MHHPGPCRSVAPGSGWLSRHAPARLGFREQQPRTRVKVKRGFKASEDVAQAEGYETWTVCIDKKFNGNTLWNILLGGIPGMAVDVSTGAMMKPVSDYYNLNMRRSVPYIEAADPSIPSGEATRMVSRDRPGHTALKGTVLRWYFDSDPRGARVFWRVVSGIPQVVKNTNETYLMTTPFEETRPFNIQGLTYENSRDVQIEIKVTKKGYEDQVKRFNVRQAIDQQEIQWLFRAGRKAGVLCLVQAIFVRQCKGTESFRPFVDGFRQVHSGGFPAAPSGATRCDWSGCLSAFLQAAHAMLAVDAGVGEGVLGPVVRRHDRFLVAYCWYARRVPERYARMQAGAHAMRQGDAGCGI